MRKWWIPTWVFVATGLALNIISALMTNFLIDDANREASALIQQQESHEKLINLTWKQVESIERKRELVLLLLSLAEVNEQSVPEPVQLQIISELQDWINTSVTELTMTNLSAVMQGMNDTQRVHRNKINQLYIQNLALAQSYEHKVKSISRQRNLALFLQILGLALMLARDLNRRAP